VISEAALAAVLLIPGISLADEGGASFWLPGIYGSLAAVPQAAPGWSFFTFNYYTNVSAGAVVSAAREVQIGLLPPTTATANVSANLKAQADLQWINPSYAFATPVLGGQLTLGMATVVGWQSANLSGTVNVTAPPLPPFTRSDSINSSVIGFGDLYPQATLRWNNGVNNFMIYGTGDIPVGAYDSTRLANLGIGHGAADGGAGYTGKRAGVLGSRRPYLQFGKSEHELSERRRLSPRLGGFAVFVEAGFCRPSRLRLRSTVV
jgi:hypothetical protein